MIYKQSTGEITTNDSTLIGTGFAGNGEGFNNPAMDHVQGVGPLPKGKYDIGEPYDNLNTGPFTLPLTPHPDNVMYGRSGFKIHGGAPNMTSDGFVIMNGKKEPVSEGCCCQNYTVREAVNEIAHKTNDKILEVIA